MKIYVYYLASVIGKINDQIELEKELTESLKKLHKTDDPEFILCPVKKNKGNLDIYVVVVGKVEKNPLGFISKFKFDVVRAFQHVQNCITNFNADVRIDPSYEDNCGNPSNYEEKVSSSARKEKTDMDLNYNERAKIYEAKDPEYSFDRVILSPNVIDKIEESLAIIECEKKVFGEWGLSAIEPHPSSALSFHGPSGSGKTMAAHAIASKLGKKILIVSYADIENKYHGEGPKNVKAIFLAAKQNDAVLFIDEADSLLSKRLTNVEHGSEQAINSMRSELLISLEAFNGIVIFATNLVVNYDQAFLTRLISVEFEFPDVDCRKRIWDVHIYPQNGNGLNIPLDENVDTYDLAEKYELSGREIKKAVVSACVHTIKNSRNIVTQEDFYHACDLLIEEKEQLANAKDHTASQRKKSLSQGQQDVLKDMIKSKILEDSNPSSDISEN